jgi:SAM-dependent methyltransferase
MEGIWNGVYSEDSTFFGAGPSEFAKKCIENFVQKNVKKILNLGCGQGRDTLFLSLNNFSVYAADSSSIAIDGLRKLGEKNNQSIDAKCVDARQGLPYEDSCFDAIYSHMFFNMKFTDKELDFLFRESYRVLKTSGLLYLSVRSDNDKLFKTGNKIDEDGIHEISGFQIRFFGIGQIKSLVSIYFKIDDMMQDDEEFANLYLVLCHKKKTAKIKVSVASLP